jgi:hypothetical protein
MINCCFFTRNSIKISPKNNGLWAAALVAAFVWAAAGFRTPLPLRTAAYVGTLRIPQPFNNNDTSQ